MNGKIKFIKEHQCETISKNDAISITYYDENGVKRWFFCYKNKLHQILYCPYCGADLSKEVSNE